MHVTLGGGCAEYLGEGSIDRPLAGEPRRNIMPTAKQASSQLVASGDACLCVAEASSESSPPGCLLAPSCASASAAEAGGYTIEHLSAEDGSLYRHP
jgi:hypothetical protein